MTIFNKKGLIRLVAFTLGGVLVFQNEAFGQNRTVKIAGVNRTLAAAPTETKAQLVDQLATALDVEKKLDVGIIASETFFKNVPKDPNPTTQTKINTLYVDGLKSFEQRKPQIKQQALGEMKALMQKEFTEQEIKYLIILFKYPAYKKLNSFLDSQKYGEVFAKPFAEQHLIMTKIKSQVKELKNSEAVSK